MDMSGKNDTTVGKLVDMIRDGELRLPEMQRRYVWPATRVRDLLDSLYRGYPSGTILVWETDREMPSRDLAVSQEESVFRGHKLLLDGQQRLTSLAAILGGQPVEVRGRKRAIDIVFNLDHPEGPPVEVIEVVDDGTEPDENDTDGDEDESNGPNIQERLKQRTFVVASKQLLADPHWVRVSDLFRADVSDGDILADLVEGFKDPLFQKYSQRLQAVRKIRDYPYVMHVLDKSLSYEEVAEIFVRVNSLGMKLRGSDLALAQVTSRWKNSLALFEAFQEECEEKWFTLDLGLIVRALVVFTTHQSRFKTVASTPLDRFKDGWEKAKDGMRFAVNFLRTNAGIEDESLLASPLYLITIGYYAMHRGLSLTREDEVGLRRWLYLGNARGHYSGSSETTLDADLNLIARNASTDDLLASLNQQVGRLEVLPEDFVGRGQRSALFSMAYLALRARGAKDWQTQLGLSLTHQGRYHFIQHHHIFPKAQLKKQGYEKAEMNEIANMAFVTGGTNRSISSTLTEVYLPEILAKQGKRTFEAHCIPLDPELWKIENYRHFLEHRRAALARVINEFIAKDEGISNHVGVEELIAQGESSGVEFKSSARWDYRENRSNKALEAVIVKTIAAFLNGEGGHLVIGVSDSGEVLGLDQDHATFSKRADRDGYQQFLVNLVSSALGKGACASLAISFQPLQGKEVCVVQVEPGLSPVYVQDGQQTRFYLRTGNTTQELGTRESVEFVRTRWPKTA
jgi:hypothetical protein